MADIESNWNIGMEREVIRKKEEIDLEKSNGLTPPPRITWR